MATALVLLGLVLGVVWVRRRRRRAAAVADLSAGYGAAMPRPWAGPARLNGSPHVRLPRRIPRPVERVRAAAPAPTDPLEGMTP